MSTDKVSPAFVHRALYLHICRTSTAAASGLGFLQALDTTSLARVSSSYLADSGAQPQHVFEIKRGKSYILIIAQRTTPTSRSAYASCLHPSAVRSPYIPAPSPCIPSQPPPLNLNIPLRANRTKSVNLKPSSMQSHAKTRWDADFGWSARVRERRAFRGA